MSLWTERVLLRLKTLSRLGETEHSRSKLTIHPGGAASLEKVSWWGSLGRWVRGDNREHTVQFVADVLAETQELVVVFARSLEEHREFIEVVSAELPRVQLGLDQLIGTYANAPGVPEKLELLKGRIDRIQRTSEQVLNNNPF